MRVVVEKSQSGKTFGIALMDENDKPYLVIKNCKIAKRADGTEFVSPPSSKLENGEWLNHAYISTGLQNTVLQTLAAEGGYGGTTQNQAQQQQGPDYDPMQDSANQAVEFD